MPELAYRFVLVRWLLFHLNYPLAIILPEIYLWEDEQIENESWNDTVPLLISGNFGILEDACFVE